VIHVLPFSGLLFCVGTFALLGFPPFGSFIAEMLILSGIVQAGNLIAFTLMCSMLTIIFVATGRSIFPMLWGPSQRQGPPVRETWVTALPKLGFVLVLVLLGVYTPAPISALLQQVAQSIGGQ
jgi:hydrogenase-4 component F